MAYWGTLETYLPENTAQRALSWLKSHEKDFCHGEATAAVWLTLKGVFINLVITAGDRYTDVFPNNFIPYLHTMKWHPKANVVHFTAKLTLLSRCWENWSQSSESSTSL